MGGQRGDRVGLGCEVWGDFRRGSGSRGTGSQGPGWLAGGLRAGALLSLVGFSANHTAGGGDGVSFRLWGTVLLPSPRRECS